MHENDLKQMIQSVSDEGQFSTITNDDNYAIGIQWDNINLRKCKSSMFFVTWKRNMTLINGDYWFEGAFALVLAILAV